LARFLREAMGLPSQPEGQEMDRHQGLGMQEVVEGDEEEDGPVVRIHLDPGENAEDRMEEEVE
jgi:hypothetical protein